jgi:type IV pilus assembly protein PilM
MSKNKKEIIAIDIGSSAIKIVKVSRDKNKTALKDFFIYEYPFEQRQKSFSLLVLLPILKDLAEKRGLAEYDCTVALSGPGIIMRKLSVPLMSKKELSTSLPLLMQKYVPFDLKTALINYYHLDKNSVFAVCVKKEEIEILKEVFAQANINLKNISIAPLAFFLKEKVNFAVIDFGESFTLVSIFSQGILLFSRTLSIGGKTLTLALSKTVYSDQRQISSNYLDAEKIKIEKGILLENPILLALIRPILEKLSLEVKRTFDFFHDQTDSSAKIEKIYLTGGSSQLKGLIPFLKEQTNLELELLPLPQDLFYDPAIDKISFARKFPYFSLAIGLVSDEAEKINFLKPSQFKPFSFSYENLKFISIAYLSFLIVIWLGFIGINVFLSFQKKNINEKYSNIAPLLQRISQIDVLEKKFLEMQNNLPMYKTSQALPSLLMEFSRNINTSIYFKQISTVNDLITINGFILGTGQEIQLSEFLAFLNSKEYLKDINLISSNEESFADEKGMSFEISVGMKL